MFHREITRGANKHCKNDHSYSGVSLKLPKANLFLPVHFD